MVNEAKTHNVHSYILPLPHVYGKGSGEWRKISVSLPAYVRASVASRVVHKFAPEGRPGASHISDVTKIYASLVERIVRGEDCPNGEDGYYFTSAHLAPWDPIMDGIAKALFARGWVDSQEPKVWESDEEAAKQLNFPVQHVRVMGTGR